MTDGLGRRIFGALQGHRGRATLLIGLGLLLAFAPYRAFAQTIGRIIPPAHSGAATDVALEVAGATSVENGQTLLASGSGVTAGSQTLDIGLARGGDLHLCSTSSLHLSASGASPATSRPLLLALDRGAVEIDMPAVARDTVMTPDLSFQVMDAKLSALLQLRMRVARNGDTCVENSGPSAPELAVSEQFGDATYRLQPGQHVLFEHGSLKEVVDHETSPCGCPPAAPISVADSGVSSANPAKPGAPVAAESAAHPFPIAVSEGLDAPPSPPASKPGEVQTQITMPMTFNGNAPAAGANAPSSSPTAAAATATTGPPNAPAVAASPTASSQPTAAITSTAPPPPPAPPSDLVHVIGRFFKRIFHRS